MFSLRWRNCSMLFHNFYLVWNNGYRCILIHTGTRAAHFRWNLSNPRCEQRFEGEGERRMKCAEVFELWAVETISHKSSVQQFSQASYKSSPLPSLNPSQAPCLLCTWPNTQTHAGLLCRVSWSRPSRLGSLKRNASDFKSEGNRLFKHALFTIPLFGKQTLHIPQPTVTHTHYQTSYGCLDSSTALHLAPYVCVYSALCFLLVQSDIWLVPSHATAPFCYMLKSHIQSSSIFRLRLLMLQAQILHSCQLWPLRLWMILHILKNAYFIWSQLKQVHIIYSLWMVSLLPQD